MIFDKELDYYALLGREAEPALTSNSLIMQLRWCLRGAGICILPDFVAREHPELRWCCADDVRLTRAFYLVRHQDDARVARINRMADVVVEHMRRALVDQGARLQDTGIPAHYPRVLPTGRNPGNSWALESGGRQRKVGRPRGGPGIAWGQCC